MSSEEFDSVVSRIEEAHRDGLRSFAKWLAECWRIAESREIWEKLHADTYPGDEYVRGYNAGVESVQMALDVYLDEFSG